MVSAHLARCNAPHRKLPGPRRLATRQPNQPRPMRAGGPSHRSCASAMQSRCRTEDAAPSRIDASTPWRRRGVFQKPAVAPSPTALCRARADSQRLAESRGGNREAGVCDDQVARGGCVQQGCICGVQKRPLRGWRRATSPKTRREQNHGWPAGGRWRGPFQAAAPESNSPHLTCNACDAV